MYDGDAAVTGPKTVTYGQGIVVNGYGWSPYSVIAVKYDGGDIKLDRAVNYNGKDYASRGVVAIIQADADGKFTYTLPFPNSDKWGVGTVHDITFLSGSLKKGDEQHSATLNVTVGDAPATAEDPKDNGQQPGNPHVDDTKKLEPQPTEPPAQDQQKDGNTGAQPSPAGNQGGAEDNQSDTAKQGAQNNAPAPTPTAPAAPVVETQTVYDGDAAVTGPKTVTYGQGIVVNGYGWSPYSVIAVKYDGGDIKLDRAVNYNGKDYASRGVVAIIQADADGKFTYTLPFPNSDKWGVGTVHDITFLSGSLQKGDEHHSVTLSFTIAGADGSTLAPVSSNHASNSGSSYSAGGYDAGAVNNGSGYGPVAPIPTQSSGINFTARQSSVTKHASLGAAAELENDTLINRVQARAKAAAKNGSNSGAHAKSAPKKTHTAKAAPGKNGTQGNATTAATQSDSDNAPNIIGAELSGFSRWFANNANNVLLSIAGLIILVLALTFRKRA